MSKAILPENTRFGAYLSGTPMQHLDGLLRHRFQLAGYEITRVSESMSEVHSPRLRSRALLGYTEVAGTTYLENIFLTGRTGTANDIVVDMLSALEMPVAPQECLENTNQPSGAKIYYGMLEHFRRQFTKAQESQK